MSQRRPHLTLVISNRSAIVNCSVKQKRLPLGFSILPANSQTLNYRIDRLRAVSPGHVAVIERLVNTVLGRLEGAG